MHDMRDFNELLSHWSPAELAGDLGINQNTAASIKRRGSIAPNHWPQLIAAASAKAIALDEAMLARFWRERKPAQEAAESMPRNTSQSAPAPGEAA